MTHTVYFIPNNAKSKNEWHHYPPEEGASCNGEACAVPLPAARWDGSFKLECRDCPAWALVAVQGSVDDPRTFVMPCGRVQMAYEREGYVWI